MIKKTENPKKSPLFCICFLRVLFHVKFVSIKKKITGTYKMDMYKGSIGNP